GLYRWVDKDGVVHYTDTPPPDDAKKVERKNLSDGGSGDDQMPYAVKVAKERNPVTLYVTDCPEGCAPARALLAKRGIPYTEKNPLTDAEVAKSLRALVGSLSVPTIVIGTTPIKGYEEASWQAALDGAGYPRTNPFLRPPAPVKDPSAATPPAPAPAPNS
ncbi:MAG: glutaredoxin family protein, partial [Betaproteobacteria bacterium]|nr:glutaredoxin family protein [Betaproteobacteria bacterium]